jgi:hypothetical protein
VRLKSHANRKLGCEIAGNDTKMLFNSALFAVQGMLAAPLENFLAQCFEICQKMP